VLSSNSGIQSGAEDTGQWDFTVTPFLTTRRKRAGQRKIAALLANTPHFSQRNEAGKRGNVNDAA